MRTPKCRVLLIEDDSLVAFDTGAQLEHALAVTVFGHRYDGAALAGLFEASPPALMLIDLCPWQEDRIETVRAAMAAGIGVVIGTVFDEARKGVSGLEEIPVLVKPYDPSRLVEIVRRELSKRHPCFRPSERMHAV